MVSAVVVTWADAISPEDGLSDRLADGPTEDGLSDRLADGPTDQEHKKHLN